MSISGSLQNAISGLTATSRMAEMVSSNLANALTEGYGRRSVDLSSAQVGGRGAGVQIDGIRRYVDRGTIADRRLADAEMNNQQRKSDVLGRLEAAFGKTDDPTSISGRLAALEQALVSAGSDPASEQRLGVALNRLTSVAKALNGTASDIQKLRQEADAAIARDVETLNTSLRQVAQMNTDITRMRLTGGDSSSLEDARQVTIDKIAAIVPLREVDRDYGAVSLMTTSGEVMLDGPAAQYSFGRTPTIIADMTLASGALGGISRDGNPMSATDGVGKLSGGSLGAAFMLRDQTLTSAQSAADTIAADLIARFADAGTDPTWTAGAPGLLTDGGLAYNPLDFDGLSGRISVAASVDPAQGGAIWRLRDGTGAVAPGPVGESGQINRWRDALAAPRMTTPGGPTLSATGQAANAASAIASLRVNSDELLSFAAARRDTLYAAETAGGVDTDQELQMLLRIEQAYAANAKVIQTIGSMMQTLMEI